MKILHTVESYLPRLHGMAEAVRQISERLVAQGHDVTVATGVDKQRQASVINGVSIVEFKVSGNMVKGINGESKKYKDFILNSEFHVICCFASQTWSTDLVFEVLDLVKGIKIFVPTGFSALYDRAYAEYFKAMHGWLNKFNMNIFLSNDYRDINFARTFGIPEEKIIVIPNGSAEEEFLHPATGIDIRQKFGLAKSVPLVLHVGAFSGIKGQHEAINIFLRADIKDAVLLLISDDFKDIPLHISPLKILAKKSLFKICNKFGLKSRWTFSFAEQICENRKLNGLFGRKIILAKCSRAETVAAFTGADVFLFPSQIECSPIVIFECMASRTPFLASDVGNIREIIKWGNGCGVLLPTVFDNTGYAHANIVESAELLVKVIADDKLRRQMADNGFSAWEDNFTWSKIAKKYENLYLNLTCTGKNRCEE